ncbi:MAG: tryptophan synthase subunit alpha [Nitrospirota bacterium]
MSRIETKLAKLKREGRAAFIPYIMTGDPDLKTTARIILELERSGADIVELGVPFSDPLADGPTIQRAAIRALKQKVNLKKVFAMVREIREKSETPIILMLYYNLIHKYGEEKFTIDSSNAGVDGFIVPDLPPEEGSSLTGHCESRGLDLIFLLAPTSDDDRIKLVAKSGSGFIYYVSLTGVTGARASMSTGIDKAVRKIKRMSKKPVCVGFGISNPEQAGEMAKIADGVIVGSAIVGKIEKAASPEEAVREAGKFAWELKEGILKARR